MAARIWLKSPLAVLKDGAAGGVVVEGQKITELVAAGKQPHGPVDETFDASEHVILPGLINTHHHFYQTLTRAHPDAINKELFDWLKALYPIWARLTPEAHRLATRLALVELMMSGATCASDHHYLYPDGLEEAIDIQVDEARKLGMRMTVTRGSMDLSQKDGGLPPDSVVQDVDTILADSEALVARHHETSPGSLIEVALAPCSPFSVSRELMKGSAEIARKCGCRLHTHLVETVDEEDYCLHHFGMRPLDYLDDVGWLGPQTWLAHGIHFNADEITRLGKAGVGVCHCPTSNMVLGSGQCKTHQLERAGAPVGLGVDGSASNDSSNMMEAIRHALMINRLTYSPGQTSHLDAIRWATKGSARCLGRSEIGAIEVGMQADLAFYKLDELRFSGAGDPIAALVLCGATQADRVMIAGNWRVVDGHPVGIDISRLRHEHGAAAKTFLEGL